MYDVNGSSPASSASSSHDVRGLMVTGSAPQTDGAPGRTAVALQGGSGILQDSVTAGRAWPAVRPGWSLSLTRPLGVVVRGWPVDQTACASWPYGATMVRAQTYDQVAVETSPARVILVSTHTG